MPSSTSNSESAAETPMALPPRALNSRSGIILLLSGVFIILAGLELVSPRILMRFSRIERRINRELAHARDLPPLNDGHPTVLLVGNSLLNEGVQIDALRSDLASEYAVSRLVIEQTHYLDWYFGLRRLLDEGSHPSVIILTLDPSQLASPFTLDESFARRQMSIRDFPQVVREAKLDRTTASNYFFAHYSNWLGDKGFIRQAVMILLVPHFRELGARIADHGSHVNDRERLLAAAQQRLPQLAVLAQSYGVQIVVLFPPALRENYSVDIQQLGRSLNVPVWVPSLPGEFSRDLYRDGFHLNDKGAQIFTTRLTQELRKLPHQVAQGNSGLEPSLSEGIPGRVILTK
jgi:hypothetical protein